MDQQSNITAIIFAQYGFSLHKLWGMTLTEKLLRQLSSIGIAKAIVVMPDRMQFQDQLRADFKTWHSIEVETKPLLVSELETLESVKNQKDGSFIVLQGNTIVDDRILTTLKQNAVNGNFCRIVSGDTGPFAFSVPADKIVSSKSSLNEFLADSEVIQTSRMDSYILKMRRRMEPFIYKVDSKETLKKAERKAFTSIYKGATDFITKYAWPMPTRWMCHLLGPTNITPNQITYISMVLSFGAIPLFFMGWFWTAWAMGIIMSFLDTLDGKLARLTLRTSEAGHWLDNASDTIYLWLWYLGIGWFFSDNLLDFSNLNTQATWALVGFFTLDKIITGLFKKLFGAQLHDFAPLDYHARVYIARRNPFLVVLLIGLILGQPVFGLYAMAVWQTATFAFHMIRFIYLPLTGQKHQMVR
ncbi:MAG: CDP-alcohol phosphatidyltransferase family protein [Cyclobacteriaceae bacterium]